MLQKLFARFDRDSTKYKLFKLCTIGDAYVAVSEPVTEDNQVSQSRREKSRLNLATTARRPQTDEGCKAKAASGFAYRTTTQCREQVWC